MTKRIKARHKYRGARERRQERISSFAWVARRRRERALTQMLLNFAAAVKAFERRLEAHRENRKQ